MVRLAERSAILRAQGDDNEEILRLEPGLELLHSQLMLREGETTTLALFKVLYNPTTPITVTLEIEKADERFLNISPARLTISEAGEIMTTITAVDNNDFADIKPINITLGITGDTTRLIPTESIAVSIANNDFYTIGFEQKTIGGIVDFLEGGRTDVLLNVVPPPKLGDIVVVALSVSDKEQLTVDPEEVIFRRTGPHGTFIGFGHAASIPIEISITDDDVAEPRRVFTIGVTPPEDLPAIIGNELSVIVGADDDIPEARVSTERTVIPEGTAASVLIDASIRRELNVNLALSGLTGAQNQVVLSPPSLTLSPDNPLASFDILVADNEEPQTASKVFSVDLSASSALQSELPSLTFIIPPNDFTAYASSPVEFNLENERAAQTMAINIEPTPQGGKSFVVFSEDPRLVVKTGLITPAQSSFPIELALSEDADLGREAKPGLSISHLDSWRQRSAQAQLSSGGDHNCAIKADGGIVCWGSDSHSQSSPTSSPQGVDADTRFLSISAGAFRSCGIKADNTVACWGHDGDGEASLTGGPRGAGAFLALSAGVLPQLRHQSGQQGDMLGL